MAGGNRFFCSRLNSSCARAVAADYVADRSYYIRAEQDIAGRPVPTAFAPQGRKACERAGNLKGLVGAPGLEPGTRWTIAELIPRNRELISKECQGAPPWWAVHQAFVRRCPVPPKRPGGLYPPRGAGPCQSCSIARSWNARPCAYLAASIAITAMEARRSGRRVRVYQHSKPLPLSSQPHPFS